MILIAIAALQVADPGAVPTEDVFAYSAVTTASFEAFGSCFMSVQGRLGGATSLVRHEDGGRISNEGSAGVANPYRIRFTEGDRQNQFRAFLSSRDASAERSLLAALKSCT